MVSIKLKSEIEDEPVYTGTENEVGSGTEPCPLKEGADPQKIKEVYFITSEGVRIEEVTKEETIEMVVKTENMAGEEVIIDLPDNAGQFQFDGELINEEKVLVLQVASDEEKIELDVLPQRLGLFERWNPWNWMEEEGDLNDTTTTTIKEVCNAYFCTITDKEEKAVITKLDKASLHQEDIYLVVDTENLRDQDVTVKVVQTGKKSLVDIGEPIKMTHQGKTVTEMTATVGRFTEEIKELYVNYEDFNDRAVFKVSFGPKEEEEAIAYSNTIASSTDAQAFLAIEVDVVDDGPIKYCGNNPSGHPNGSKNVWLDMTTKALKLFGFTINIHHDGKISKSDLSKAKKVNYRYFESDDTAHELGSFNLIHAQKWKKGSKYNSTGAVKKVVGGKTRYYTKDGKKKSELFTPFSGTPKTFEYDKGNVSITLHEATSREYFNPEAFACLLGALAEVGFEDVVSNGSVGTDGTGAYSVTHVNGINMDFKYLRKDKKKASIDTDTDDNPYPRILVSDSELDKTRQNEFCNALYTFGYGRTTKLGSHLMDDGKLLDRCKKLSGHENHLHIQGFKANYK